MLPADRRCSPTKITHVSTVLGVGASAQPHPANYKRNYFGIWNTGTNIIYLRFGQPNRATATGANGDIPVPAGQGLEFIFQVPVDSVNISCPSGVGGSSVSTAEGLPVDPRLLGGSNG